MIKITQILYSGLGGHGSVAFSILDADKNKLTNQSFIFYGIEELKDDYQRKCESENLKYVSILLTNHLIGTIKVLFSVLLQRPKIVLLHSPTLFLITPILTLFGKRVIFIDHTPNATKSKVEWFAIKFFRYFTKYQVYLTEYQYEDYKKRFGEKFFRFSSPQIISNGLDIEKFSPDSFKKKNDTLRILMQARFSRTKDFQTLIRAIYLLKDQFSSPFHLFLAGDGETWEECVQLSTSLGLESYVTFLGMASEDILIEQLRKADLYVHSSLSETMSTAIMQALSVGLPCLVSDIAGNLSLIKEGENGWLFKTGDEKDLGDKMKSILSDELLRDEMSQKARKYAEKHLSMKTMFDKYYKLVQ